MVEPFEFLQNDSCPHLLGSPTHEDTATWCHDCGQASCYSECGLLNLALKNGACILCLWDFSISFFIFLLIIHLYSMLQKYVPATI